MQMRPIFKDLSLIRGEDYNDDYSDEEEGGGGANPNARPVMQQVLMKKKESDRAQSARLQVRIYA